MKPNITLAEVEQDLAATINDELRCKQIASLIQLFITDSGGEDRRFYNIEVLRWEALANQAASLKVKIQTVREELQKNPQ